MSTAESAPAKPVEYTDCTESFRDFCKTMAPWQVVRDENVSMENLISALECFDPKTDASLNWKDVKQLPALLKDNTIPAAGKLSAKELVDTIDTLFALEHQWMEDGDIVNTLGRFAYAHDLELLNDAPALKAYTRALFKGAGLQYTVLLTTGFHEEEEFSSGPAPEVPFFQAEENAVFIEELQKAIEAEKNEDVKARLAHRLAFFTVLDGLVTVDYEKIKTASEKATETLAKITRKDDVKVHAGIFHTDAPKWWTNVIPQPTVEVASFTTAHKAWTAYAEQYKFIGTIHEIPDTTLLLVAEEFARFSRMEPTPLLRSACYLTANAPNGVFLGRHTSISHAVLDTLAGEFGAPIYKQLMLGDKELAHETEAYWRHRKPANKAKRFDLPQNLGSFIEELSSLHLEHFVAVLSNKGRTHRRLGNIIQKLATMMNIASHIDDEYLCASHPMGSSDLTEAQVAQYAQFTNILTTYCSTFGAALADKYLALTMKLGLHTPAETQTLVQARAHICNIRKNIFLRSVATNPDQIPARRVNRKTSCPTTAPVLYSRTVKDMNTAVSFVDDADKISTLTNAIRYLISALEKTELIKLANPAESVVSAANSFDYRCALFAGHFFVVRHQDMQKYFESEQYNKEPVEALAEAAKQAAAVAKHCKTTGPSTAGGKDSNDNISQIAKATFVAANLIKKELETRKEKVGEAFEFIKLDYNNLNALPHVTLKLKL